MQEIELIFRVLTGPFIGIGGSLADDIWYSKRNSKALVIEIVDHYCRYWFYFWLKYF
ncbi:MAG: hypothetical protein IPP27_15300 [Bacteroidetes bacterium]|nr:hypothetical protein [Bacteroidota bacterium]